MTRYWSRGRQAWIAYDPWAWVAQREAIEPALLAASRIRTAAALTAIRHRVYTQLAALAGTP